MDGVHGIASAFLTYVSMQKRVINRTYMYAQIAPIMQTYIDGLK